MAQSQVKRRPPARAAARATKARGALANAKDTAVWYEGKAFTDDWTSWHFPKWIKLLAPLRRRRLRVMEIGSWEGRSAIFFLNYLPQAQLTCIDTFAGGQEHQEAAARNADEARKLRAIEAKFDRNTATFKRRIEKVKADSTTALIGLGLTDRRFDIAYIDGGHRAAEVYSDAALTWPLIAKGGIVIFDDYQWKEMPKTLDNPAPGIDAFLKSIKGQYRTVLRGYQIAIEKL